MLEIVGWTTPRLITCVHLCEQDTTDAAVARHNKGCNCKKSFCLKKYCECFQAAIFCSETCKCVDCKNFEVDPSPEPQSKPRP